MTALLEPVQVDMYDPGGFFENCYTRILPVDLLAALSDEQREDLAGLVAHAIDANHGHPTLPLAAAVVDAIVATAKELAP